MSIIGEEISGSKLLKHLNNRSSSIAREYSKFSCCPALCLFTDVNGTYHPSNLTKNIQSCQQQVLYLDRNQKNEKLFEILKPCVKGVSEKGYSKLELTLGRNSVEVCRKAFCTAFSIGNNALVKICREINSGATSTKLSRPVSNQSAATATGSFTVWDDVGKRYDIALTQEEKSIIHLPNTVCSIQTYLWLRAFFKSVGDHMPNKEE
jgi:hypothetical protein